MSAHPAKRRKTSPLPATPLLDRDERAATTEARASYMSPTRASLSRFNPNLLPNTAPGRSRSSGTSGQNVATPTANANIAPIANMTTQQMFTPDQFMQHGQEAFNSIIGNFNAQMQRTLASITGGSAVNSPAPQFTTPAPGAPSIFGNAGPAQRTPLGDETDEQMEAMRAAIRARKLAEARASSARPSSGGPKKIRTPISGRRSLPPAVTMTPRDFVNLGDDEDELSIEIGRNDDQMARSRGVSRAGSARSRASPESAIKSMSQIAEMPSQENEEITIDPTVTEELEIDELSPDAPKQPLPAKASKAATAPRVRRLATAESEGLPDTPEAIRRQLEAEDHPRRGVLFSSPSKRKSLPSPKKRPPLAPVERQVAQRPKPVIEKAVPPANEMPVAKIPTPPAMPDPSVLAKREEKARLEKALREMQSEIKELERIARVYTEGGEDAVEDLSSVVKLLNGSRASDTKQQPEPALSSLLTSFLPFSIPTAPAPSTSETPEETFVSHEPLKEDDPLPMNSLFTPLAITSVPHPPKSKLNSSQVLQTHSITFSSPGSLLICELDMTVSSSASGDEVPSIETLELKSLSPWAKAEIGHWIDERCKEGDIAAVGYALGRYWDICTKRAQTWNECETKFPSFVDFEAAEDNSGGRNFVPKMSKKELLPYLGRSILNLQSEEAILRVQWKLHCDWTGEVESVVGATTSLPDGWHETDTSDALRKIPATFDAIMRERGIVKAVEVVGGLLFDTHA